ncbi:MAG: hypothetical protein IPJ88_11520 [Myxococcales bacterium]|nr:MAG: hypothetical protein IPJ88_11520 [Myxococcales bacterium]
MRKVYSHLLVILGLSLGSGCAQNTAYRRSAVVPTPIGEPLASPMKKDWQFSGGISVTDTLTDEVGTDGDPAMHAAQLMFHGIARRAISKYFNIGAQAFWSNRAFSQKTTVGTLDVPDDNVWGAGLNAALQIPIAQSGWTFGTALAGTIVIAPWAVWQLQDDTTTPATYSLNDSGHDGLLLYRLSISMNYDFSEAFAMFGGLSLQNSASNIGFGNAPQDGSTLTFTRHGVVPFIGVNYHFIPERFAQLQYYVPLGYPQFGGLYENAFGGFSLNIGAEI